MKRFIIWLLVGVGIGYLAYAGVYRIGTERYRELSNQPLPELAWLKTEFGLSEEEYQRIRELHLAYLPRCAEMCALIAEKNEVIRGWMHGENANDSERENSEPYPG